MASAKQEKSSAPPASVILAMYIGLGAAISFLTGREPGTLPDNLLHELAPSVVVLTIFLTYYELADCLGTGICKGEHLKARANMLYKQYAALPEPEACFLAQRAQTNQVEQMNVMIVGTVACAIYVNGYTAAVLAGLWSLLRMQYSQTYRKSLGLEYGRVMKGISAYTIPCYFLANAMLVSAGIHAVRCLL